MQAARKRLKRCQPYPDDMIEEILVRLPAKSLLTFKYVSKTWFSLINSPRFARANLNHPSDHNFSVIYCCKWFVAIADNNSLIERIKDDLNVRIGLSYKTYIERFGDYIDETYVVDPDDQSMNQDQPHKDFYIDDPELKVLNLRIRSTPGYFFRLMCCCDGMLLGSVGQGCNRALMLWNPTINEYKTLPLPDENFDFFNWDVVFGYNSSIDDYKLVSVSCLDEKGPVKVLALKSNSWRTITSSFSYKFYKKWDMLTPTVNGKLYWIAWSKNTGNRQVIVEFDLATEVFSQVPLPLPSLSVGETRYLKLSILDGCLSLFAMTITGNSGFSNCELWVMTKEETWVKLHRFFEDWEWFHKFKPLYFTKEGEVVASVWRSRIRIYDKEFKTYKELKVPMAMISNKITEYSATLVSPLRH